MSVAKVAERYEHQLASIGQAGTGLAEPLVKLVMQYQFEYVVTPNKLIGRVQWTQTLLGLPGQERFHHNHIYFWQYEKIAKLFEELMKFGKENDLDVNMKESIRQAAVANYSIQMQPGCIHQNFQYVPLETGLKTFAPWSDMFVGQNFKAPEDKLRFERFRLAREIRGQTQVNVGDGFLLPESERVWIKQITGFLIQAGVPLQPTMGNIDGEADQGFIIGTKETCQYRVTDADLPRFLREVNHDLRERERIEACCQEEEGSCFCCWTFMINLYDCLIGFFCCLFCSDRDE